MPNYKPSSNQVIIEVLASVGTVTSIAAYGSSDDFTNPALEFADDEIIAVAGSLTAADGADLTGVNMSISVDGGAPVTSALYGFTEGVNFYQLQIGTLPIGTHTVVAQFPRTKR